LEALHQQLTLIHRDLSAARDPYVKEQLDGAASRGLRLHLGSGSHRLPGWVNIDACGGDIRMDLRWPLPFPADAACYVYACHVAEHLYRGSELPALLREIRRVLAPCGVFRIVVPDIEQCLRAYVRNDERFFQERARTWAWSRECRTRLEHFLGYAGAQQMLENLDGHVYGYDFDTLAFVLHDAGFAHVERSVFMGSKHAQLRIDCESPNACANTAGRHYSLFVEAS